jgi:gamma-glutamylcyclotransferase (GGCT)/AIG2-like uncharacterized protein YtfP
VTDADDRPERPPEPESHGELGVFVYGTLKEGFKNHSHFCRGATETHPAVVWGRLHLWAPTIPILAVPPDHVLHHGTPDLESDLATERRIGQTPPPASLFAPERMGTWRRIHGELIVFPDPVRRLKILDALEGFRPRTRDYYARALVPIQIGDAERGTARVRTAWTYVLPSEVKPPSEALDIDTWQPGLF